MIQQQIFYKKPRKSPITQNAKLHKWSVSVVNRTITIR